MIRRFVLTALLALLLPVPALAQDATEPRPLIVLLEANPWLMVIGSDSPRFALYDDGTVIYATEKGYKSVKLDATERAALVERVKPEALAAIARHYEAAAGVSDQPTEYLFVFGNDRPKVVSVYGSLQPGSFSARDVVPVAIPNAYDVLRDFSHPGARDWLPDKIEVMIWPYEYAPEASIDWPKGWPGPNDPATVKRGKDSYSLYLSSADYPALLALIRTQKEKGAVRIDGHKWSVSWRFPFPQEKSWDGLRGYEPD